MRLVKISTTAYEEEDFFLLTNLTDDEIAEVVQPIVNAERDGYEEYDNESIWRALTNRFPNNRIDMIIEFDELKF
jgi:hypothetical protein